MQSMETKGWILKGSPRKGKLFEIVIIPAILTVFYRFGWTNASFQYGLSIINPRMRRALEMCAPYETYDRNAPLTRDKLASKV
jgi:hypothetical protein